MAIQDIWLANLKALVAIEGNGEKRKGLRQVADVSGLSEEYIYQLVEGKPKKNGDPREVGKAAAKKIALAFANGRPDSWFDSPSFDQGQILPSVTGVPQAAAARTSAGLTLGQAMEFLADYLAALQASDRKEAMRQIGRIVDEPESHAKIAVSIEGMARTPFAQDAKKVA